MCVSMLKEGKEADRTANSFFVNIIPTALPDEPDGCN